MNKIIKLQKIVSKELKKSEKDLKPDIGLEVEEWLKGEIYAFKHVLKLIDILQGTDKKRIVNTSKLIYMKG